MRSWRNVCKVVILYFLPRHWNSVPLSEVVVAVSRNVTQCVSSEQLLLQDERSFLFSFVFRPLFELTICKRRGVQMYNKLQLINLRYGVRNEASEHACLHLTASAVLSWDGNVSWQ
jgi:hypothetical protein